MFKRYLYLNYRQFSATKFIFGRRVTRAGWLLFSAFFFTGALSVDTNLSLAFQTFSFLVILLLMSVVGMRVNRGRLSAERILPRFGSVGEKIGYKIIVRSQAKRAQRSVTLIEDPMDPRPTFTEFRDTPEPGEEKRNWFDRVYGYYRWEWLIVKNTKAVIAEKVIPDLPPQKSVEMEMEMMPLRRGHLHFVGTTFAFPDPFGLFRSLRKFGNPQTMLILPKRYKLSALDLPGISKFQMGGVAMASSLGESEEFVSLRDYRPGDPLRHIHWKSFAKVNRPIVKEFQDEFFVRQALILDTFDVHQHSDLFEEAVSVAASFACSIQTQDALLDLMFVGPQAYCFTTGRGVGQMEQMMEILASVQPCENRSFESLKHLVVEHIGAVSGCICVLLKWDETRQNLVEHLKILGIPVMVLVVSEKDEPLAPGPMADHPERFHVLPLGKIGECLAKV